jgi:hypothetical protein
VQSRRPGSRADGLRERRHAQLQRRVFLVVPLRYPVSEAGYFPYSRLARFSSARVTSGRYEPLVRAALRMLEQSDSQGDGLSLRKARAAPWQPA